MDPERKRMSWDLHGNVSQIWCFVNSRRAHKARNNTYCKFAHIPCQATNYSVSVTQGPPFSGWIQYPKLEGKARAAAENLTCWVHDADLLTCTWAVGREAPRDTQYHLYLENLHSFQKWPCSQYRQDEWGTNVECRFDDLSVLSPELNRFSVNGSSRESPIPCSEITKTLHEIERLTAPTITSAWCNQTYSIVQWQVRSHFREDFEYELEMQQGAHLEHKQTEDNFLKLSNPGTYTVRIRARHTAMLAPSWGEWSVRERFVCGRAPLPVWLTSLLIALGTLLALALVLLLCRRYAVMQQLFPPIPHVKDPISDHLQNERMVRGGPAVRGSVGHEGWPGKIARWPGRKRSSRSAQWRRCRFWGKTETGAQPSLSAGRRGLGGGAQPGGGGTIGRLWGRVVGSPMQFTRGYLPEENKISVVLISQIKGFFTPLLGPGGGGSPQRHQDALSSLLELAASAPTSTGLAPS
ncbi:interleukin-3 receptor subunit alpha isoform X2 [Camelus dromedarius]